MGQNYKKNLKGASIKISQTIKTNPKTIKTTKMYEIFYKEFLPHLGKSMKKRLYFIGYMIKCLINTINNKSIRIRFLNIFIYYINNLDSRQIY